MKKSLPQTPLGFGFPTDPLPLKMSKISERGGSVGKSSDIAFSTLYDSSANSLLLLGKNVRGFLLRNHNFARGADSSEWLRVNVV